MRLSGGEGHWVVEKTIIQLYRRSTKLFHGWLMGWCR